MFLFNFFAFLSFTKGYCLLTVNVISLAVPTSICKSTSALAKLTEDRGFIVVGVI